MVLPEVGAVDVNTLDPVLGTNQQAMLLIKMLYSGLVRLDKNLNVLPDQATWSISGDRKVYTFHLKSGLAFSDGTPITAYTYEYTLARALLPALQSGNAGSFLGTIVGAEEVHSGKSTTLSGVRALDSSTLMITLTKPTGYFLQVLASPLTFPVNANVVKQYGEMNWSTYAAGNAVGSGPFLLKQWLRGVSMVLVPNPHYYGAHPRLMQVNIIFVTDAHRAFETYQGGQYSLVWNMLPSDLGPAGGLSGFASQSLLQTDTLFFNQQMPPFNQKAVRQAFAYATDNAALAGSAFNHAVEPATTLVPPGIPGYQSRTNSLAFDPAKALAALQSVYPDMKQLPTITLSYPGSQVSSTLASALQQMWQANLGVAVKLLPLETNAYNIERAEHHIQLGLAQESTCLPDPYAFLVPNLVSGAVDNYGNWTNSSFDTLVLRAEQASGSQRMELYAQAEQLAIDDVGQLPLDYQSLSAIIPSTIHGVSLNPLGLFFGDWSDVYFVSNSKG